MRFSEWLKLHRKAVGISQKTLSDKVGSLGYKITGSQISNYEREYDKDKEDNPTRPPEKFVDLTAQVLSRPINEARTAAGYAELNPPEVPRPVLDAISRRGVPLSEKDAYYLAGVIDTMPKGE